MNIKPMLKEMELNAPLALKILLLGIFAFVCIFATIYFSMLGG